MFNHREQRALFCLIAVLCVGSIASVIDYLRPQALEEFSVVRAVSVPDVGASAAETNGPLDLNRATATDLQALPHIGPKMAARIVAYRKDKGFFSSVDDLEQVRGIGSATLGKLRPLVRVGQRSQAP